MILTRRGEPGVRCILRPSLKWALLAVLGFATGFLPRATGQVSSPGAILAQSHSGQFSICALPSTALPARLSNLETNRNLAWLVPTLVPTSCERIKQSLWRELGVRPPPPWRGKIFLILTPVSSADDPVTITADQFRDRWQYRVELPQLVDRTRYVRAIIQVLLLEMANRNATARSAEIPSWLLEGLTQEVLASSTKDELIPPPPQPTSDIMRPAVSITYVNALKENPLRQAHEKLILTAPLSFQDLSWPGTEQVGMTISELYRDSAQLFVDQLLAMTDGPACLRAMIEALPEHFNWQFAFLRAFHSHFQRPLDIEKWWALQAVHFTGRDLAQMWPPEESWQKLDALVRSDVQIRFGTNDLPVHGEVSLQTIITDWDAARQTQALKAKLQELELLRIRVAPEFVPLATQYYQVIASYLSAREHPGSVLFFRKKAATRHAADETVQQLAALDRQRILLRPITIKSSDPDGKPGAGTNDLGRAFANESRLTR